MNIEIERKFLIERPAEEKLKKEDLTVREMVQTYLSENPENGAERRVRLIKENGATSFVFTEKEKLKGISRSENEYEISESEYCNLKREAVSELTKTRYAFPYKSHKIEIDVYPYEIGGNDLEGKAVLEVELQSEDETFALPDYITVIRELTGTREFSNKALAKSVL